MKYLSLILTATFILLLNTTYAQTIRRVNNNVGITGVNVYTTAQAAHDAAAANDILIIEPSNTSYGNLTLIKPLKIYGNGYYLDTNTELKVDQRSSITGYLYFNTGSDGSEVYGIQTASGFYIQGVSNIVISRCNISYGILISNNAITGSLKTNVDNILISKNWLKNNGGGGAVGSNPTAGYTISNVLITNNITTYLQASDNIGIQNWIIQNNTFWDNSTISIANSVFVNNLITLGNPISFSNVSFSNNVSNASTFSGGIGNQNNYEVANELIGSGAGISLDEQYQLKTGSPLKTAGSGGTEVGAYGGATPYIVSGIPAIPSVTGLTNTGTGSNSVPMQVIISVKSNN
jgi:hypothetical protein